MHLPHLGEGGFETYDVMPDVTFGYGVISPRTAFDAGRTALRLCRQNELLPFVESVGDPNLEIFRVNTFSPAHYTNSNETLFGHVSQIRRARSFIQACKALDRFAGMTEDLDCVYIMLMKHFDELPAHKDVYDGARSMLQLAGQKIVEFDHNHPVSAVTNLFIAPGDAYQMQFRDDDTSVEHSVTYYGAVENVALYVNY